MNHRDLLIRGRGLTKVFGYGSQKTTAVDAVDFDFHKGKSFRSSAKAEAAKRRWPK